MDAAAIRRAAIDAFHATWKLLEKADRTAAETEAMLAAAAESHALWLKVGTAVNDQRGEWMLARTAVDAGRAEAAVRHAERTLALTAAAKVGEAGFADFDFAFAEEVTARAFALAGDLARARRHYDQARRLGEAIAEEGDRTEFFRQFALGPWFGLTS
ncbi:MAG: hypothetical protein U1E56_09985 [Bauldia sp.]